MSDQIIHLMYFGNRFLSLSKSGQVLVSEDGLAHSYATPADLYGLLLEAKLAEARRSWWVKLLEKLK